MSTPMTTETKTTTWTIDPAHTQAGFKVKHMMIATVRGRFTDLSGTLELDEEDWTRSKVSVEIDAASIDTREEDRDAHLRSGDFLDVETHPEITFESASIEEVGDDRYTVRGDLTIRGETRPVDLDVEVEGRGRDPWGGERIGFAATTKIDRRDFGLTWNKALETGGVLVGQEVEITLDVEVVKREEETGSDD